MARLIPILLIITGLVARPAAADTRWTMVRTDSLILIGDQSASTLRDVAVQMEQFRAVVGGLIHNADRPPALPTVVYVFGSRKAMQPYLPVSNGKPAAIAGYFQRDQDVNAIVISLEGFDESAEIAYHEYTHLLVDNAVRSVPVWLNEGLAEYYSTYHLASGGKEASIGRPPEGRLTLLRQRLLPLADIIGADRSSSLYNESNKRSIFYAEAWALTHYLLSQGPDGGAAINRYAAEYAEGKTPREAFFNAFGKTPEEFDKLLFVYTGRTTYSGTRFIFKDKIAVDGPGPSRTLSTAEANAWLGDLQRRLGRDAEAAPRIDGAVAAEPDVAVTHLAAGLLRLTQSRTSEGLLELEKAAALAPDDFLTQYLYGLWLLRSDSPQNSEQSEAAAIAALTRATQLRPESSDAYAALAYAQMQSTHGLVEARASIERAIALAPGRVEFRLRWADIRILQGAYDEARTLLTTIAAMRGDTRSADGAQQRLDRLAEFEQRVAMRRSEAASNRRTIEVPADSAPTQDDALRLALRTVRAGEQRVLGRLTFIDCGPAGARFRVKVAGSAGEEEIVSTPTKMDAIELISYLGDSTFTITCGARPDADLIYMTTAAAGAVVAVEFLPRNYRP